MTRNWKLALLIGGLTAAAVFAAGTIAFGAAGVERGMPFGGQGGGMMLARDGAGTSEQARRGCDGSGLMQDPQAREDMWELRNEHRGEIRDWWDRYGDDPSSAAAQKALEELRTEHADDMRALFEKYGVEPPAGLGEGGRGGCGGPGVGSAQGGVGGQGCGSQGLGGGQGMMGGTQSWGGGSL